MLTHYDAFILIGSSTDDAGITASQQTQNSLKIDQKGTVIIHHKQSTELDGLRAWSNYSISLAAATKAGRGVKSQPMLCTTAEDGLLNQLT